MECEHTSPAAPTIFPVSGETINALLVTLTNLCIKDSDGTFEAHASYYHPIITILNADVLRTKTFMRTTAPTTTDMDRLILGAARWGTLDLFVELVSWTYNNSKRKTTLLRSLELAVVHGHMDIVSSILSHGISAEEARDHLHAFASFEVSYYDIHVLQAIDDICATKIASQVPDDKWETVEALREANHTHKRARVESGDDAEWVVKKKAKTGEEEEEEEEEEDE